MIQSPQYLWVKTFYKEILWLSKKVKISLLGSMKEFQTEVDDKKKFTKEIEELIQNGGMYWIKDEDGEIGINAKQIHSIEFVDDTDKREAA